MAETKSTKVGEASGSVKRVNVTVSVRDLQNRASAVLREVTESGRARIVTNRGRPVAILAPIDADELGDWALVQAQGSMDAMLEAERDLAAGDTADLGAFLAELDD